MSPLKIIPALLAALVVLLCGSALAADKTVGVVLSGDLPRYHEAHKAFVNTLARAGYDQDKVAVFVQTPNPDGMSWTNSVRKFVGVDADVIVAYGAPAALAATKETDKIPVVFAHVYDPPACGAKKGNSTGVSSKVPMVTLLKTLKSITPFSKLAVIYNPDEKDSVVQLDEVKKNSSALGYQVIEVAVKSGGDVKGKAGKAAGDADSIFITCSAVAEKDATSIIAAGNRNKVPTVSLNSGLAEKGALLGLAPSASEQGEIAAGMVARILKGEKPSGLAVENSRKVDLVLNLKAANGLDMKVPFDVLNAATKVIK